MSAQRVGAPGGVSVGFGVVLVVQLPHVITTNFGPSVLGDMIHCAAPAAESMQSPLGRFRKSDWLWSGC